MTTPNKRPHGQLRHSQVVTTFGPGSLVDLPNQSAIVGGLEHWFQVTDEIHEPRLIEKLKRLLNLPSLKLFSPPPDNEDPTAPRTGLTVWQFPEWFISQNASRLDHGVNRGEGVFIPRPGTIDLFVRVSIASTLARA
ncbi:hypothetical protein [Urbifossiella limnaea]|uniref:Uncharacterized protein n=1 Tax=Urbifossiella limnaea TaxID=2528023 RepID=A0A517XM58_9BACT|nr:hypothetical protein [Urbifossiella limnaea]QDU18591.1 hypothetical protein ETAA1_04840 [Urbifossiella limnaea]